MKPTGCYGMLPIFIIEDKLHFTLRLVKIKMFCFSTQVHVPCELPAWRVLAPALPRCSFLSTLSPFTFFHLDISAATTIVQGTAAVP